MRAAILSLLLAAPAAAAPDTSPDAILREHLWAQLKALPASERPKVGLALSGGGVRGLAHVGVITALQDAGFPIDAVSGTSMGAIVGAFHAAGMPPDRLWEIHKGIQSSAAGTLSRFRLLRLMVSDSLLSTKQLEQVIDEEIGQKRFDQIPIPFACVAMDIRTGEKIIFREGPLAPAVRASMNLPGLFKPVLYRHRYLVDGGVVDYIPIDAAKLLGAEWVIASVTEGDYSKSVPTSVLLNLQQVIDIRGALLSRQQRKEADLVIEPAVGDAHFLDFDRGPEMTEKGVLAAKKAIPGAQESLILRALPRLTRRWGIR